MHQLKTHTYTQKQTNPHTHIYKILIIKALYYSPRFLVLPPASIPQYVSLGISIIIICLADFCFVQFFFCKSHDTQLVFPTCFEYMNVCDVRKKQSFVDFFPHLLFLFFLYMYLVFHLFLFLVFTCFHNLVLFRFNCENMSLFCHPFS